MTCRGSLVSVLPLLLAAAQTGCDGCGKKQGRPGGDQAPTEAAFECAFAVDCKSDNPCAEVDCVEDLCVEDPLPAGTLCGEATVCGEAPKCDGRGECVAGAPVAIDDGNPCTIDSCDPLRGVLHEPVSVDDSDACTEDSCDPATGKPTHEPVDIDDGDDCTFDACDPVRGVTHAQPEPKYRCEADCGDGFHAAFRRPSTECGGGQQGAQTFCQPNCGASFYTCDAECPPGYQAGAQAANGRCGPSGEPQTFCKKN